MAALCWAYLVVSSDKQEDTLEEQRVWAERTALENGWTISRNFQGVSTGKHGVRRLMETLLADLQTTPKAHRPARILMVRLDRTGRGDTLEVLGAIGQIRKLGCIIHTRLDGDIKLNTVADTIKPIFDAFQAGLENEVRSDRSRAGHERKRRLGMHAGHAPYGIVLIDGKPNPYEPEAAIVRQIFDLRLQGWGMNRLARLVAASAPPKKRADGGTRKMRWGENTIARMLSCETYKGIVVEERVFDAASGLRLAHTDRTPKHRWPLIGALKCTCGLSLTAGVQGNGSRVRYYYCRSRANHEHIPNHRAEKLEQQFVELLHNLDAHPELVVPSNPQETEALMAQKRALERERDSLAARRQRSWDLADAAGISPDELRKRLHDIGEDEKRIESALGETSGRLARAVITEERNMGLTELIARVAEDWPNADPAIQRDFAKAVAEIVGGLWVPPAPKPRFTRFYTGVEMRVASNQS